MKRYATVERLLADSLVEKILASKEGKWHIVDWTNALMFDGKKFSSSEEAEDFLSEKLGDAYETDRGEYDIIPDKGSRDTNYLDPKDPRHGKVARGAITPGCSEAAGEKKFDRLHITDDESKEIGVPWQEPIPQGQDPKEAAEELAKFFPKNRSSSW